MGRSLTKCKCRNKQFETIVATWLCILKLRQNTLHSIEYRNVHIESRVHKTRRSNVFKHRVMVACQNVWSSTPSRPVFACRNVRQYLLWFYFRVIIIYYVRTFDLSRSFILRLRNNRRWINTRNGMMNDVQPLRIFFIWTMRGHF